MFVFHETVQPSVVVDGLLGGKLDRDTMSRFGWQHAMGLVDFKDPAFFRVELRRE